MAIAERLLQFGLLPQRQRILDLQAAEHGGIHGRKRRGEIAAARTCDGVELGQAAGSLVGLEPRRNVRLVQLLQRLLVDRSPVDLDDVVLAAIGLDAAAL